MSLSTCHVLNHKFIGPAPIVLDISRHVQEARLPELPSQQLQQHALAATCMQQAMQLQKHLCLGVQGGLHLSMVWQQLVNSRAWFAAGVLCRDGPAQASAHQVVPAAVSPCPASAHPRHS